MLRKGWEWLRGRVLVEIGGLWPERFLNLCAGGGLTLRGLRQTEGGYQCWMLLPEYRRARRLARKSKTTLRIQRKEGLPFFLFRHRKRKAFAAGMVLALALLGAASLFLWDIQMEGNLRYTDDTIRSFLRETGVDCGMRMSQVDCPALEAALRNQYPQITWVSAQISGSRLILQMKENDGLLEIPEPAAGPSDLVAERDGVVTEIVATNGIPQVKAGEEVSQGQVLISGRIPLYDDSENLIRIQEVAASGSIAARSQVPYSWERSVFWEESQVISRRPVGASLLLGSYSASAGSPSGAGPLQFRLTEYHTLWLSDSFSLPVTWAVTWEATCQIRLRRMTEAEQDLAAEEALAKQQALWEEQGYQVVETSLERTADAFTLRVEGTVTLEGPLGISQPLEETPEETEGES